MAFAKTFKIEVTVPKGLKAGDTFEVEVEAPELPRQARGQLAGIALADMTDEQLKRELINSKSVLYKAEQRGADQATIDANKARVEAAKAEKAKRTPVAPVPATPSEAAATEGTEQASTETDAESAAEM